MAFVKIPIPSDSRLHRKIRRQDNFDCIINNFGILAYPSTSRCTTTLAASGFGGATTVKKGKGQNRKTTPTSTVPFDVNAALSRLERKYEELRQADAKRIAEDDEDDNGIVTSEYIVAVRPSLGVNCAVSDWVPVAHMLVARQRPDVVMPINGHDDDADSRMLLHTAVSCFCRELAQLAVLGSRVFVNVPRNQLQYSVEASTSFYKHVYDNIFVDRDGDRMALADAVRILGLDNSHHQGKNGALDHSTIKKVYRTLSMKWHPDRLVGQSDEDQQHASLQYSQVKLAYETLVARGSTTSMSSWYESLGGRERTDFFKLDKPLLSIDTAQKALQLQNIESAVAGLDPDFVQGFVARSSVRLKL